MEWKYLVDAFFSFFPLLFTFAARLCELGSLSGKICDSREAFNQSFLSFVKKKGKNCNGGYVDGRPRGTE